MEPRTYHWYLAAGRPCAEEFMRLDGVRPAWHRGDGHWLSRREQFHQMRGVCNVIHIVDGWWMGRGAWEAQDFLEELLFSAHVYPGFQVYEREEAELFGPGFYRDLYPWTSYNPWREDRERHRKNTHGFPPAPNRIYNSEGKVILTPELQAYALAFAELRYTEETQ